MSFRSPGIVADATRKALVVNDGTDAHHNDMNATRASLDEQELHELEHSLYYAPLESATAPADASAHPATMPAPAVSPAARRRLIDRLLRRG